MKTILADFHSRIFSWKSSPIFPCKIPTGAINYTNNANNYTSRNSGLIKDWGVYDFGEGFINYNNTLVCQET